MAFRGLLESQRAADEGAGRLGVVVGRAGAGVREQARVVDAADEDGDAVPLGGGQQVRAGTGVEEGVAARAQHDVDVGVAHEAGEHRGLVHPGADGPDDALGAQFLQCRVGLGERLLLVSVGVVEVGDVDAVEAEPGEALLQAATDTVGAEVPDPARLLPSVAGYEEAADLGRDDVRVAGPVGERGAEAAFGQPEPVVRRRVEGAYADVPGGVHGGVGLVVLDRGVEVAEGGGAEDQLRDRHATAAEGAATKRGGAVAHQEVSLSSRASVASGRRCRSRRARAARAGGRSR